MNFENPVVRLLVSLALGFILLLASASIMGFSFFSGLVVMNGCMHVPEWSFYIAYGGCGLALLVFSVLPPLLLYLKKRWYWVVGTLVAGGVLTILSYFIFMPIAILFCK
jgi:hypothetical protein